MKNPNFPPFYVGQRVVALSDAIIQLKKGKDYIIKSQERLSCGCWVVEVFGVEREPAVRCVCGNHKTHKIEGSNWIDSSLFAPIETTFESISFKKVVEIESPLIGIN